MLLNAISIGNELLSGDTVNTNFSWIGRELTAHGYSVYREYTISDEQSDIGTTISDSLLEAHVTVAVGGLGPTKDDVTRRAVAEALNVELQVDQATEKHIEAYLAKRNVRLPDGAARRQAMVPEGGVVLTNKNGTAPGLWYETENRAVLVVLPGPPREMQPLFSDEVIPRIKEKWRSAFACDKIYVCGIPESRVAETVDGILGPYEEVVESAYCVKDRAIEVRLTSGHDHKRTLEEVREKIQEAFGINALPPGVSDPAEDLIQLLKESGKTLGIAESCTGGLLGGAVTEVSGASAVFEGGFLTYSNRVKESFLGVPQETLNVNGAVSEETAEAMAWGIVEQLQTDCSLAVTGIAGPGGGTETKPVGLVFIAVVLDDECKVMRFVWPGSRETVRGRTVAHALNELRTRLRYRRENPCV